MKERAAILADSLMLNKQISVFCSCHYMLGAIYISNKMGLSLTKSILGSVAAKKKDRRRTLQQTLHMTKNFFKIILKIHSMAQRNCHIPC